MTMRELTQIFWLKKEIKLDEERLKELEYKASPSTSTFEAVTSGKGGVTDRTGNTATAILELQEIISAKKSRCEKELAELERYITSIEDSFTRQIFIYRYVCAMDWESVARAIGGGNTGNSIKKRCQRYVWSHQ